MGREHCREVGGGGGGGGSLNAGFHYGKTSNIFCACENPLCVMSYDIRLVNGVFKAKLEALQKIRNASKARAEAALAPAPGPPVTGGRMNGGVMVGGTLSESRALITTQSRSTSSASSGHGIISRSLSHGGAAEQGYPRPVGLNPVIRVPANGAGIVGALEGCVPEMFQHRPKRLIQICVEAVADGLVTGRIRNISSLPQDLAQQVFDYLIENHTLTDAVLAACFKDASLVSLDLSRVRCIDDSWAQSLTMLASASPTPVPSVSASPAPSPLMMSTRGSRSSSGAQDGGDGTRRRKSDSHSSSNHMSCVNPTLVAKGLADVAAAAAAAEAAAPAEEEDDATIVGGVGDEGDGCDDEESTRKTSHADSMQDRHFARNRETSVADDDAKLFFGVEKIKLSNCRDIGERTMRFVSRAPMVSELLLDGCVGINDECLEKIKNNLMVERLSLAGCIAVTSRGLTRSVAHFTRLTDLSLDSCWNISELSFLGNLHYLRTLSLGWCYNVGDDDVGVLAQLANLTKLDISKTSIGDAGLRLILLGPGSGSEEEALPLLPKGGGAGGDGGDAYPVSSYSSLSYFSRASIISRYRRESRLEELKLDGCNVSGESLRLLARSTRTTNSIKVLSLQWCHISDADLAHLVPLPSLTSLNLSYTQVSCVGMRHVAKLRHLASLKLDSCNVGDEGIQHLANGAAARRRSMSSFLSPSTDGGRGRVAEIGGDASSPMRTKSGLVELDLSDTSVTNMGLRYISEKMLDMEVLNLSYTAVNDDGVEHLKALRKLTSLNLDSHAITDHSLRHVSQLSTIRHLDLFGSKVTDHGLKLICTLTFSNLLSLEVCGGGVTDTGVRYISQSMVLLESLNLANNSRISDDAMPALCMLKALRNLNLTHSRVTSEGILHLIVLQKLESLSVHECKISKPAIAKLHQSIRSLRSVGAMNMKSTSTGLTFSSLFDLR